MALSLRALAGRNWKGENLVRNLQYGLQTLLVIGIWIEIGHYTFNSSKYLYWWEVFQLNNNYFIRPCTLQQFICLLTLIHFTSWICHCIFNFEQVLRSIGVHNRSRKSGLSTWGRVKNNDFSFLFNRFSSQTVFVMVCGRAAGVLQHQE